jgi:Holliday junction resolvase RusA-like endonuclease
MFMLMFGVEGIPVPKGRPRFARKGNFVSTYTDKKTLDWEKIVKQAACKAMGSSEPLESPVSVFMYFRLPIPQSWSKKRQDRALNGLEHPVKKPDWDNLGKAVSDAMNGVVFQDDAQVISAHIKKAYSSDPGVDILIREEVL